LGGSSSAANALNNFGQVVGYSASVGDTTFHAFLGVGQTLFDLNTLGGNISVATAISDGGHVTGYSQIDPLSVQTHAFLMPDLGGLMDLGTLGGTTSSGAAVNGRGQVVGDSTLAGDLESHAFLFDFLTGLQDLRTLGGTYSSPAAINQAGHVTGESTLAGETETHAFWHDGTTLHDLGTLGGTFSSGYAINDAGTITGDSSLAGDTAVHAFLFRNGTLRDLGTLGGTRSTARAINNADQVVGMSLDASGRQRAFLWQTDVMVDLNTLLPPNSGWELQDAHFINDAGQIAGTGLYQGQSSWFLLTPQADDNNHPPVAVAGPDQTQQCESQAVTLDGTGSSDPDGDVLSFEWLEQGVALGTTAILTPSLSAGSHTFLLRVTDTHGASAEDSVTVVVGDTVPPVVRCPEDRSASADDQGRARVPNLLEGLVATDNCTDSAALLKTQSPAAGTMVPAGAYQVTVTVKDAAGNTTSCSCRFTVTTTDTTPPIVNGPESILRRANSHGQAEVPDLRCWVRARDNTTPPEQLRFHQEPAPGTLVGLGHHRLTLTVTDLAGNTTTFAVVLQVVDVTPPRILSLSADPSVLRPTDGRLVPVTLTAVATDNCDPHPGCRIVAVTSSQPVKGSGDVTTPDWEITGDLTLRLRAETAPGCGPRVYSILVASTDASGNSSTGTVLVQVPRAGNGTKDGKDDKDGKDGKNSGSK
jgi:probable HAF family extracellular repeat protein